MTSIDREIKALKDQRERYRVLRDRSIMGSPDFFFWVGKIQEVDEQVERVRERT